MKKILLFAMGVMMSMASYAQEDVTHYIVNAGLDEDLTFQSDGATKEIVDKSHSFSDRSQAWVAADSTVYAWGKGSRSDGHSPAWNGFYGQIKGWQQGDKSYTGKLYYPYGSDAAEWVYFGTVPYNIASTAVPIADDGTTFLAAPEKPAEFSGDDNIGFMYLRAGWGGSATYKQVVKLPCAQYRLEYWTINANAAAKNGKNMSRVVCRKDVFTEGSAEEAKASMLKTEWTKHEIEFIPTAEFTVEFGFQAEGGSGSNPFLCIDGIKLFKIGEADPDDINRADMNDLMAECQELAGQAAAEGFIGLASYIGDYEFELEDHLAESGEDLEKAVKDAEARMKQIREAVANMANVNAILAKMDNLLQTTDFPGKADFEAAYQKILSYKEQGAPDGGDIIEIMLNVEEEANTAIKAYYMSQQETASEDNPADFSIFIQNPWFIKAAAEPTLVDGAWVFPNADSYTEGSTNDDLTSTGWTVTGTYTGGDQRLNWQRGRSCWNAWGSGINGTVAIGQAIEGLPNGYYTVSADLITQSGCLTDQHTYAQSSAEKKRSTAQLTTEGWDDVLWETVSMSATDKVLVVDGKLTIGAEGTGTGSGSAGWFLATNFKLNFLGKASDEEIAAVVKKSFEELLASAKEQAGTMHFAADKKTLNDSIAKYEGAADKDAYLAAVNALTAAITEAQKSESKYEEYFQEGKTLPTIKANLEGSGDTNYGEAKEIAQFAYDYSMNWINSEAATYNKIDSIVNHTKDYVNTYIPVFMNAAEIAAAAKETGKKALTEVMNSQKATLIAELQTATTINEMVAVLNKLIEAVKKQNIWEDKDNKDYTPYIQNPTLAAEDGWTFERGNGDKNTTSGQWYDGSSTKYIDSYHSQDVTDATTGEVTEHIGLIGFKASQVVKDLPNGTYQVGVYTRTPAEGAYIFTAVADTAFVEIPMNYYTDETTGEQVVASDTHGPIWQEAYQKIIEESMSEDDPQYSYYSAIYNANGALGRGWQHQQMEVTVTNHELTIGTMCGTAASKTEKVFGGNWYSVGGWTLSLISLGDNTGYDGPVATGIETTKAAANIDGIYSISGVKANKLQRGLNIVIRNGKAMKVIIK